MNVVSHVFSSQGKTVRKFYVLASGAQSSLGCKTNKRSGHSLAIKWAAGRSHCRLDHKGRT